MNLETQKLHLIEEFLKIKDQAFINELEAIIKERQQEKSVIDEFAGIWSKEDVQEMKQIISEGCEQINENDW